MKPTSKKTIPVTALLCVILLSVYLLGSRSKKGFAQVISTNEVPVSGTAGVETDEDDEYVFRRSWGGEGDKLSAGSVAVSADGTIFVANSGYHRITRISPGEQTFFNWGNYGTGNSQFHLPSDIALDGSGNIYVVEVYNHRVQKFRCDGQYAGQWGGLGSGAGQFWAPEGIAVDNNDNVYVADTYNDRIQKFDSNGAYLTQWGSEGSNVGEFKLPYDVAVDNNGNVYVADTWNHRIQKFTSSGSYLTQWGSEGSSDGQFSRPYSIAVDSAGYVYVADRNYRIQKFTSDGTYLTKWNGSGGIAIDQNGDVYVASGSVTQYSSSGDYLREWGKQESYRTLSSPFALALDSNNVIYVTNTFPTGHVVEKFNKNGVYLGGWGSSGSGMGQFSAAMDLAIDSRDNVYVVSDNNHQILKFTSSGVYLTQWGGQGSDAGEFNWPEYIALDGNDDVYVVDTYNYRVQKFNSDGEYLDQWDGLGGLDQGAGPGQVAVDSSNNFYVADTYNHRVVAYNSNGVYLGQWGGAQGSGEGQFSYPYSIVIDDNDYVYVGDETRTQKFQSMSPLLAQWIYDDDPFTFDMTPDAFDDSGNAYVTDGPDRRIMVFGPGYPPQDLISGLILNGSFEDNPSLREWTYDSSVVSAQTGNAANGSHSLLLGEPSPQVEQGQSEAWAHQTFYVRPEWERPILSFRYNMHVNDIMDYSDFFVAIQDGVGLNHLATVLRDGYQPCGGNIAPQPGTDLGWRYYQYDLSAFKGEHIRLVFFNRNLWPQSWGIWTYLDDVRVVDAGPETEGERTYLPLLGSEGTACGGFSTVQPELFRQPSQ